MRILRIVQIVLALMAMATFATAQTPEKIYGKNRVLKPNAYYLEQIELWKKEVDAHPQNADAWLNYYRANRNAVVKGEDDNAQKSKGKTRFERLKHIVDEMAMQVPNSYEYNFVKWLNGNNDPSLFPYLEKAHALSPQSPEPIMSLIFYYETQCNYPKRNESIEAYCKCGDYSPGLLNYSYNLLTALDSNALISTEGDKDTEAILLLTQGKKYRSDVRMLNVNLLLIREYREKIFAELGIAQLDFDPVANQENFQRFQQVLIPHLAKNKLGRPIYAAVTLSHGYRNAISDQLYLTGLAYRYSETKIDNLPLLIHNIEELFLLDYLQAYFPINDISVGNVQSMNGNYVYPFATLSQYYARIGNAAKAEYYQKRALKVATEGEILEEYLAFFPK